MDEGEGRIERITLVLEAPEELLRAMLRASVDLGMDTVQELMLQIVANELLE